MYNMGKLDSIVMQAMRFEREFKTLEHAIIEFRDLHHKKQLDRAKHQFIKLLTAIENLRLSSDVPLLDIPMRENQ